MNYTLVTKEESQKLYKKLATSHLLGVELFGENMDKYSTFMIQCIITAVGELASEKLKSPVFSQYLLKEEITEGMNDCLLDEEITAVYGELYLARENRLVEIVESLADTMLLSLLKEYDIAYKAANN